MIINSYRYAGGAAPSGLLLDDFPNAAAAYSLRKLRAAYTGAANRVVLDNTNEHNIGFAGNDYDVAALQALIGSGGATVGTMYNQGTILNDAVESVVGQQATIANAGVVEVENGKPCIVAKDAKSYSNLGIDFFDHLRGSTAMFVLQDPQITGDRPRVFANNSNEYVAQLDNVVDRRRLSVRSGTSINTANNVIPATQFILQIFLRQPSGVIAYVNGVEIYSNISTVFTNNVIENLFTNLGAGIKLQEAVFWRENYESRALEMYNAVNSYYNVP